MSTIKEDLKELIEIYEEQQSLNERFYGVLKRIKAKRLYEDNAKKKFTSCASAIEYILQENGEPLHVKEIITLLRPLGFIAEEFPISDMLKTYAQRGKFFTYEGGNTFGLL